MDGRRFVRPHWYVGEMSQNNSPISVAALFAGAGGLDLGFSKAGFNVPWANEYDKDIWATYERNFPKTKLDRRSITEVEPDEIPEVQGFIGGPPCQSWSEAGSSRGIDDKRGQLFWEYLRLIEAKKPHFFLAENVSGILFNRHSSAFKEILEGFANLGYNVTYGLLNANDYGVPQDRERVIIVGYRAEFGKFFSPPKPDSKKPTLGDAIKDLEKTAVPALETNYSNPKVKVTNHEFMVGGFSSMFMSRNRVREWGQPSFTIQAGGRHAPLHPQAPRMNKKEKDLWEFQEGKEHMYRRLTVRECARVQAFPDDYEFVYNRVADGYKMIGNAVPVEFARRLAKKIHSDLMSISPTPLKKGSKGEVRSFEEIASLDETKE
jgi:DNA (cytosine-5)-methyltransferase 1